MFQKIIGIAGVLLILGTIVMVALSPKAEGFFPGLLNFSKTRTEAAAPPPHIEVLPVVDTLSIDIPEPLPDSLTTE